MPSPQSPLQAAAGAAGNEQRIIELQSPAALLTLYVGLREPARHPAGRVAHRSPVDDAVYGGDAAGQFVDELGRHARHRGVARGRLRQAHDAAASDAAAHDAGATAPCGRAAARRHHDARHAHDQQPRCRGDGRARPAGRLLTARADARPGGGRRPVPRRHARAGRVAGRPWHRPDSLERCVTCEPSPSSINRPPCPPLTFLRWWPQSSPGSPRHCCRRTDSPARN